MSSVGHCGKCGESISNLFYEEEGEYWCEECYTQTYHIDAEDESDYLKMEKCVHCFESVNELYSVDCCEHTFCESCLEYVCKVNYCIACCEQVDEDYVPNTEICKSCYNQYCSCNCYKRISIDKDELFAYGLFITFHNKIHPKLLRCIIDMCESRVGYKDFEDIKLDEIRFDIEDENSYIVSVPNKKINAGSDEFVRLRMDVFSERQMEILTDELLAENICLFNPKAILYNLKYGVFKHTRTNKPEKVFDTESCPICLECYDESVKKATGSCGHTLCKGCFDHICKSNNSRCPECRAVWDDITDQIEWELKDIEELCKNGDVETLKEIVNIESLKYDCILVDGYGATLGYDDESSCYDNVRFRNEVSDYLWVLYKRI